MLSRVADDFAHYLLGFAAPTRNDSVQSIELRRPDKRLTPPPLRDVVSPK